MGIMSEILYGEKFRIIRGRDSDLQITALFVIVIGFLLGLVLFTIVSVWLVTAYFIIKNVIWRIKGGRSEKPGLFVKITVGIITFLHRFKGNWILNQIFPGINGDWFIEADSQIYRAHMLSKTVEIPNKGKVKIPGFLAFCKERFWDIIIFPYGLAAIFASLVFNYINSPDAIASKLTAEDTNPVFSVIFVSTFFVPFTVVLFYLSFIWSVKDAEIICCQRNDLTKEITTVNNLGDIITSRIAPLVGIGTLLELGRLYLIFEEAINPESFQGYDDFTVTVGTAIVFLLIMPLFMTGGVFIMSYLYLIWHHERNVNNYRDRLSSSPKTTLPRGTLLLKKREWQPDEIQSKPDIELDRSKPESVVDSSIPTVRFCTDCGHKLTGGARFCMKCGTKV